MIILICEENCTVKEKRIAYRDNYQYLFSSQSNVRGRDAFICRDFESYPLPRGCTSDLSINHSCEFSNKKFTKRIDIISD